ncbi:hypothetical protein SAMN05444161_9156 [Rhizobiales bacterium GAS191]|nr:hypothetical protein SAMN05444161_9156 [Rhizobiales bacterium GAS191]
MSDVKSTTQVAREEQANKSFAKAQAEEKRKNDVFAEEAKRLASDQAKTAKLRALREAREAEELAAKPAPKFRKGGR